MDFKTIVRKFVVENFLFGEDGKLEEDTSFLEKGIVDSTGILELVAFLEETFRIQMEDEELIPENLDSISNVVRYLQRKAVALK
ncbi:MAG: acyl carrier protein [Deltaproteobacteria bacterium RBG_19FT_COMBO_46_9]|nr:MAG: acyl carrier protein [Deltaproteobacteria bacterium RBG_19FT_COMBO_46_9]